MEGLNSMNEKNKIVASAIKEARKLKSFDRDSMNAFCVKFRSINGKMALLIGVGERVAEAKSKFKTERDINCYLKTMGISKEDICIANQYNLCKRAKAQP